MAFVNNINNRLGKYLRQARIEKGLTQKDLSEIMGYTSPQFISNIERGLCSPPLDCLREIIKNCDADINIVLEIIIEEQRAYLKKHLMTKKKSS